jgi:exopolysaccharide production protein ExoQ
LRSFINRLEAVVVGLALAFPIFGTFMPLENYLNPNTAVINAQNGTGTFGFTSAVEIGVEAIAAYLFVRYFHAIRAEARRIALPLGFVALVLSSAAWSADPSITAKRAFHLVLYSIFAIYLVQKYDIKDFTSYITRVIAVPVFASIAITIVRPDLGFSAYQNENAVRGALVDKNALGNIMAFAALTAGNSFALRANNRLFAASVLLASLALAVLAPSTTTRILIPLLLALAAFAWLLRKGANPGWKIIAVGIAIVGIAGATFAIFDLNDLLDLVGKSSTLTGRTDVWRAVYEAIRQKPLLGYGDVFWGIPGTARDNIWLELGWPAPHAHETWLDTMLQLGLLGLSLMVLMWLVALSRAVRLGLFMSETGALFMALILTNLFLRSWTETLFLTPSETYWLWFAIAYLYLARMSEAHKHITIAAHPALAASG